MISKKNPPNHGSEFHLTPDQNGGNPLPNLPKIRTSRNISKHIQTLKIRLYGQLILKPYIYIYITIIIHDNYSICPYFCCSQQEKLRTAPPLLSREKPLGPATMKVMTRSMRSLDSSGAPGGPGPRKKCGGFSVHGWFAKIMRFFTSQRPGLWILIVCVFFVFFSCFFRPNHSSESFQWIIPVNS